MRQGHKMRDGAKRAEKLARRTARKIAGKSRSSYDVRGADMDRIRDRLRSAVARRCPDRPAPPRPERPERPRPDCPHVADARVKSKPPRGYLPPDRPTWLVGRRALQSIRGQ